MMSHEESITYYQNALQKAKDDNMHLRQLADASEEMIAFIDSNMCYIAVNQPYAYFHNQATDAFAGIKVEDIIGKDNFSHISALIQRSLKGESFTVTETYTLPDKTIRYEEIYFKPVKNEKGTILGCVAVIKNISQQKKEIHEIEISLDEQNKLFRLVNDENPDIILMRDYDGRFLFANDTLAKLYKTTPEEMIGKTDEHFNPNKEQRDFFLENIREIMDKFETQIVYETSTDANTGEIRHFQSIKKPIKDKDGKLSILVIAHDITELRNNELQLRQFAAVIQNSREGVMIADTQQKIVAINEAFTAITGYNESEAIGQNAVLLKSEQHNETFYAKMWESITTQDRWSGEIWNKKKNNEIYPEWLSISTIRDYNNEIINYVGIFSDLSTEKASEEKISYLALHDTLTGLYNRYQFENRLEHALLSRYVDDNNIALLFLDLDNFKDINDTYGHETGDKVLQVVAKELQQLMRKEDTLARFGGDEFVILSEHLHSKYDASIIAKKILQRFHHPIKVENKTFHLSCSIGIALHPYDGENKSTLLKAADTAMYKAKENGKRSFAFYDSSFTNTLISRLQMEDDLRVAFKEEQFELYYQPQISLSDGKIIGLEALIRWHHPKQGLLTPKSFMSIIEENHMIITLGEWIITTACSQAAKWQQQGIFDGRIAVNISAIQLEYSEFPKTIANALNNSKLPPNQLEIEITESVIMKTPKRWVSLFSDLKKQGVHFAIDDFGTGYSSLSYLRQLPLNLLKIDKSFVDDIPKETDACAIVDTIISLASKLGLTTLAEGVETKEEASFLISSGCTYVQGYLYDKPLDAQTAEQRLQHIQYNVHTGEHL